MGVGVRLYIDILDCDCVVLRGGTGTVAVEVEAAL